MTLHHARVAAFMAENQAFLASDQYQEIRRKALASNPYDLDSEEAIRNGDLTISELRGESQ